MATGVIKELVTAWGFDVDMAPLEKMEKGVQSLEGLLKHTGEFATGLVAGLFGIADFTANTGHEISMTAQRLDIAAAAYQAYSRAARMSGVDQEGFNASLTNLNNLVEQIPYGGEGGKILGRLGISPYANGQLKNTITLLNEIGEKFQGLSNREAGFFTHQLFGRPSPEMVNFLKALGAQGQGLITKAASWGGIFSDADLARSEKFHEDFEKLKYDMEGLGATIGLKLMPPFEKFMQEFEQWTHDPEGRQFLFHDMPEALENIVLLLGHLSKALNMTITGWNQLIETVHKNPKAPPRALGKPDALEHFLFEGFGTDPSELFDRRGLDAWNRIHQNPYGGLSRDLIPGHPNMGFPVMEPTPGPTVVQHNTIIIPGAGDPDAVAGKVDHHLAKRARQTNQKTTPDREY